jgi:ribulose-phosphate 3-epimerase
MHLKIAPSVISADFSILQEEVQKVEKGGADLLHIDVYPLLAWGFEYRRLGRMMIGPLLVEVLKNHTRLPLDVHLAIEVSDDVIRRYVRAGSDIITVHAEACVHPERVIRMIKDQGLKAGIALNPATPLSLVKPYLTDLDLILLMTTSANFGGLDFTADTIPKIRMAATMRKRHRSMLDIEVDGKKIPQIGKLYAGSPVVIPFGNRKTQYIAIPLDRSLHIRDADCTVMGL